jgi:Zn-dependent M28 family amino/carboxypeptidase
MTRLALLALLTACTSGEGKLATDDDTGASHPGDGGGDEEVASPSLVDRMDIDRLIAHLDALQDIADGQADTRVVGSDGYRESADYVAAQLEAAGFAVTWQEFAHASWRPLDDPELLAGGVDYADDIGMLAYTPAGEVTAPVVPVDVTVPVSGPENSSSSGCESADFADFPAGAIALIQRGSCTFTDKAVNAEAAGAVGVIVFNEGQSGRRGIVEGTLGGVGDVSIPVVGATYALGEALVAAHAAGGVEATLTVEASAQVVPTWNLMADIAGEREDIVVVGAHLDSVAAGPGINDNGSGTALVLELALQMADMGVTPTNTMRFAWWGAEEAGLIGSSEYVYGMDEAALEKHLANLNFDMVASPNGGLFVYDGDNSDTSGGFPAPAGSDLIESLFTDHFDAEGLDWAATAFDGRSDYGPFIYYGIPAGGLFSGAEGVKSWGESDLWGGDGNAPYDACYHQGCDTSLNIDPVLFLDHSRAAAAATEAMMDITDLGARRSRGPAFADLDRPTHHHVAEGHCGGGATR